MDIEQLTKSQIVLLTLLVSFMTSIATGIVTVALMQQAPPAIVQSVSKVIKETVAQVAPVVHSTFASATTSAPQVVKTIVVSDSELVAQAVAGANKSVVRIYSNDATSPQFVGLGIMIDLTGTMATDEATVGDSANANIRRANGSYVRVIVSKRDAANGIVYLTLSSTSTDPTSIGTPATFSTHPATLGGMVVALEGSAVSRIQTGFVTALPTAADTGTVAVIETDVPKSGILDGTPLIDTDGSIVGLSTDISRTASASGFIPSSVFTSGSSHGTMKEPTTPAQ